MIWNNVRRERIWDAVLTCQKSRIQSSRMFYIELNMKLNVQKWKKDQNDQILHEHIVCNDTLKFEITNLRTSFINFKKIFKF